MAAGYELEAAEADKVIATASTAILLLRSVVPPQITPSVRHCPAAILQPCSDDRLLIGRPFTSNIEP
jgi:hypothetical protein